MKFIQFLNHHTKKITLTLCAVITFEFLSPTLALALTAGPTAPEATSFEPVDTTDMVNPLTGSLTYNLPLLEVPGPEGGYPLSLSYHAGIQPDVEASWVGLGWTLNPGAINRNVSGLPDDFSDVTFKRRDYWAGGNRKEFGLEVGFASVANVGLVFASDTYQGFGIGANFGIGRTIGGVKMGLDVGIGPYGGNYVSASASVGIRVVNGIGAVAGVNAATNFESVGFGSGASLVSNSGQPLLSASMNTSSSKPSLSVMGINSTVYNKNAGKISSSGSGFGITVPLKFLTIGVNFKSERYWIDETAEVETNGSLYTPVIAPNTYTNYLDNRTFDNYRLLPDRLNIIDDTKDQEMVGGTYPEYDNYSISGQGIGGQIKPFLYQRALSFQNQGNYSAYASPEVSSSLFKSGVGFRFVNDFSNTFDQGFGDIVTQGGASTGTNKIPFSMEGKPDNRIGNELASSKHIKYFTNDEIKNNIAKAKGFIDVGTTAKGFQRLVNGTSIGSVNATKAGSQIGGFMVTNESGVTYHYALPVYTYDEFSYNYTLNGGFRSASTTRKEPYAYTWLLTAVTGPDYVDRNSNGLVDDGDWGYWTAMDYGKWTNDYVWRTPATGKDADLDQNYQMYSFGKKQLYYLNKIRTRTHTAIFEKEVRLDNKGNSPDIVNDKTNGNDGKFDSKSGQSLRLNRIYLFNNADANIVNETSETASMGRSNDLYSNVIDSYDVAKIGKSTIESKAIRVIDFGFSYDLSKETINSYNIRQPEQRLGKLTLDGLQVRGKGGVDLLPITTFSYDLDGASFKGSISNSGQFTTKNPSLELGMMIQKADDNSVYYGMITNKTQSGNDYIYTLVNSYNKGVFGTDIDLKVTKNPPYCKDCNDIWGFYKGDIIKSELALNMDLAKRVTPTSAKGVDAWNLRKISSPLGSSIELDYESNEFQKSVFQRDAYISIKSIIKINDYNYRVEITGNRLQFDEKYKIGDYINGLFLGYRLNSDVKPNKTAYRSWSGNKECFFEGWTSDNKLNLRFTRKLDNFQAGNIYLTNNEIVSFGGGARIKSVSNKMMDNTNYQTTYNYREANVSTGVNSYLPNTIESGYFQNIEFKDRLEHEYKKDLNKDLDNILKYAREIPGPGVMYGKVRIQTKVIKPNGDSQVEGFTENRYRVLDSNMINRVILQDQGNSNDKPDKYNTYNVNLTIADFTANVGDLLGIRYYDAEGMLIKEIENHYIIDDISSESDWRTAYRNQLKDFNNQGLIVERFAEVRSYHRSGDPPKTNIVMAAREQFPAIMLYSTIKDYVNGSSETSINLGFDFLNGQANKVLTTDSYGNRFLSETSFAYQQNTEMGSKLINMDYKNMMSQIFSQINYKVDANNKKTGVISGSKTIWSKDVDVLTPAGTVVKQNSTTNGTVWRKKQVELLEIPAQYGSTGILPISAFSLTNGYWKLTNVLSLYNVYSKGLEDFDRNNNYSANRYGYKNSKIVAGANFSKYAELAFSGAEDELTSGAAIPGEVSRGGATVSTAAFHTGSKSLSVPATAKGFEYSVPVAKLTPGRTYIASVWVKNTSSGKVNLYYDVDGVAVASPISSAQSTKKSGDWTLVNLEIPAVAGTTLKVFVKNDGTAASFVDDFRFHPKNTSATAYVYDTFSGELTYILDHLNLFTRFEYDAMGRLVRTYKEQFGRAPYKTNEYQMNYGTTKSIYYNDRLEEMVQKNDCPTNAIGGYAKYIVPAGKYSSTISKGDANSKALYEMNTLGQANANATADCISCNRYKVTIPKSEIQNMDLHVSFKDCNNQYQSFPYSSLEMDFEVEDSPYIVLYVCTHITNKYISFSGGQGQPDRDISAQIELVGNCY
ncbi:DUF5977 domain-containing protein [Sphingobacterium anhuiense]|uniref:DUF5977 domain-containing protein n=1 Tax=Sphingobacterium anhuiense TaxID=493780 RepID=UPI003C2D3357